MFAGGSREIIRELRQGLAVARAVTDVCRLVGDLIARRAGCDEVVVAWQTADANISTSYSQADTESASKEQVPSLVKLARGRLGFQDRALPVPLCISDVHSAQLDQAVHQELKRRNYLSFALIPLYGPSIEKGAAPIQMLARGWIECHCSTHAAHWRKEDVQILEQISELTALVLERFASEVFAAPVTPVSDTGISARYSRLAEYGNMLMVRTDEELKICEVLGDTERILGVSPENVLKDRSVWVRCLEPRDLRRLALTMNRLRDEGGELNQEIRVRNSQTGTVRWIMVKGRALHSSEGAFSGWEGLGLDITESRAHESELRSQARRIEALYEVSRTLMVSMDPSRSMLKGLRALLRATSSDCGYGCFYDRSTGFIEIVAAEGVSEKYLSGIASMLQGKTLVRHAIESREGLLIEDIQDEPRAAIEAAKMENLHSAILMPLMFEDLVLGAIVLFRRQRRSYSQADYDLVTAACGQVGLAIRQSEMYSAEKRQARALAALYRLSHELSKHFTPREIAAHAFPIIQEELACKRMWLGVINEQGSHLVGQAGTGLGMRRQIVDVQIELSLRHDFLDEAIKTRQPVIVQAGQPMECSGLNRIVKRLNIGTFVVLPLVALGQLVGVLVVEPSLPSTFFAQRSLPLLNRMAGEIATVILARRFEQRVAEADKMRMAGLLSSGVAHNFNNLLQAIIGQASLIEMQAPENPALVASSRMIVEASSKGAALIKQMQSFSLPGGLRPQIIEINEMMSESRELYRSVLGTDVTLEMVLGDEVPSVKVDAGQLQQVITNLLVNAREAIGSKSGGAVRLYSSRVRLMSGEVDPELAPGQYLRIDIEDNGIGMDPERQARCFEPFFTTKNVDAATGLGFGGTGLGLSSAYSIMKQQEGLITVSSSPGDGSVFSIYVPAHLGVQADQMRIELSDSLEHRNVEVMLWNLDDSVRFPVKSSLEALGSQILEAKRKEDLLNPPQGRKNDIKLVILDPDHDENVGDDFMRLLSKSSAGIRMVVVSADAQHWNQVLNGLPNVEILSKPSGVWGIQSAVRSILHSSRSAQKNPNPTSSVAGLGAQVSVERENKPVENGKVSSGKAIHTTPAEVLHK